MEGQRRSAQLRQSRHADLGHLLVVRHKDEVGVLAGVLTALQADAINVESMNIVFCSSLRRAPNLLVGHHRQGGRTVSNPSIFAVDVGLESA